MTANGGIAISAIGMTTPVGLTAAQSCAALRAGISALAELDFLIETDTFDEVALVGCPIRGVTEGYRGLGRWARLAALALKDLLSGAALAPADAVRLGLYLALPPVTRGGIDSRLGHLLPSRIAESLGIPSMAARARVYADGHAAGARACQDALADLAGGVVDRAIVCGIDSLVEPETLRFFLSKRRLKTEDQTDGFLPGEGAACFLIERVAGARARGAIPLAILDAAHSALEPITIWHDQPSAAVGLGDAIAGTFQQLVDRGAATRVVVCDLNGESYRAREFGNTASRVLAAIPATVAVWHPADCIGDTGAAAFAISTCVAAKALAKGYAKGEAVLVFGSSDDGLRGAASLRRVPMEA
jgi:3-oxoacyl-[acyl-carrier-protein] synthase-1